MEHWFKKIIRRSFAHAQDDNREMLRMTVKKKDDGALCHSEE